MTICYIYIFIYLYKCVYLIEIVYKINFHFKIEHTFILNVLNFHKNLLSCLLKFLIIFH